MAYAYEEYKGPAHWPAQGYDDDVHCAEAILMC